MPTDPVCKMQVDERTAAAKATYNGKAFYFCSEACKKEFEKDHEKFKTQVNP